MVVMPLTKELLVLLELWGQQVFQATNRVFVGHDKLIVGRCCYCTICDASRSGALEAPTRVDSFDSMHTVTAERLVVFLGKPAVAKIRSI